MSNPFVIEVSDVPTGLSEPVEATGPSPVRWGGNMLAVEENTPVEVHGTLSNLGEAVLINAQVQAAAAGTCSLCLQDIQTTFDYTINDVFGFTEDFISGDDADDEDGEPLLVKDGTIDITQLVLDEAGLNAPFSPVCEDFGQHCVEETPTPAGTVDGALAVGGESARPEGLDGEDADEEPIDPRWAALKKFTVDDQESK
ncbi:DUF177 domain-containing protein [Corynebacterium sp. 320]|uniref:YceD family protein n=1 Tax=Corynebacterium TaxID=1716 RepID=UPI00125CBC52|nr:MULTISPECIES: DUF177 domain-containing protein [Corynebacterium]KAB1503840.1 DUF177 domain-containing protein [Corynebacterium sp. 320]KAB1553059.1 DUF177 domain-containing protein [Corynebacterium sp. 321]KAB1553720.1 DUF177 domain-containing protein [Corynebacterium sp. 319]KAB3527976.1 DUF177 domain-containing protein [Corynebacterium sp. 250]KAB3540534.1 DUF177 domain-containing protein [Corynebacterium sp. 366]